jgi:hypothetical protein
MTEAVGQAARSQLMFREVNERIAELTTMLDGLGINLLICECSDDSCAESLQITPAEYEAVRAHGKRFVVLAGHQLPGIERVVDGNERFLVVEKVGEAGEVAMRGDPRGA